MSENIAPEKTEEKDLFTIGLEMYNNKEPYDQVIDVFEKGVAENPSDSSYYTCLSWLYILRNKGGDRKKAVEFAKNALRYDPTNAQAQYNLVLGYLFTGKKGVRDEFEKAISMSREQDLEAAKTNLKEAIEREGYIHEVEKMLKWIDQA